MADAYFILADAGVPPERIRVEGDGAHWRVIVRGFGSGATDATDETMDTPEEVAAALAASWREHQARLAPPAEAEEILPHESDPQAAAPADDQGEPCDDLGDPEALIPDALAVELDEHDPGSAGSVALSGVGDDTDESHLTDVIAVTVDAEFSEPTSDENGASGAFIFGDNLGQLRTSAIGIVVRRALEMMPKGVDFDRLASLRNFTMGVSEGRWPDDEAKRRELDGLEATLRTIRYIEARRDEKVAFLVAATRPQIEAFDPEAGW